MSLAELEVLDSVLDGCLVNLTADVLHVELIKSNLTNTWQHPARNYTGVQLQSGILFSEHKILIVDWYFLVFCC